MHFSFLLDTSAKKIINVHCIFLPCAPCWTNVGPHQFSQLVLLTKMPAAGPAEAVRHGGLSQGLGIWTLCTLTPCIFAMFHFWNCEVLQLPVDLSSSVTENYNAGKSLRFMNLWYVPCHYENCALQSFPFSLHFPTEMFSFTLQPHELKAWALYIAPVKCDSH